MAYTLGWVAGDWTIDSSTGAIRYIGDAHGGTSPSYVTVIDLHRELQDFADRASSSGDDLLDISSETPSERSTDTIITLLNGFNIDDLAAEHIYDGSIIQSGGAEIYDGVVNFGNVKYIVLHQDGAILNDSTDFWNSYSADATANYTFPPNNTQAGVSHNFLVKVRTGGADIDGRYLLGLTREFNFSYGEFQIQGTSRGSNVLALSEASDLNNETTAGTLATWNQFSNVEAYDASQDIDPLVPTEEYYSRWNIGVGSVPANPTINDLYEYTKYLSRRGTASTLYGLDGDLFRGITHEVAYSSLSGGVFAEGTLLDINGVSGAAMVLASDDGDPAGTVWIQLLKLSVSITGTLQQGGVTATAGAVQSRPITATFLGQSTGSALIGAYGIGVDAGDLLATDALTDLGNQAIAPPNNVTFTVSGLVHDEDRVLVAPATGGAINTSQMLVNTDLTGAAVTSVQMQAAIPTDIPASGTLRVINDSGFHVLLNYSSFSGDTFTVSAYNFSGTQENDGVTAANNNGAYVTYIDELTQGAVVNSDSLTIGDEYEILTVVGDDFTTVGSANNTVGTRFTATGADAGGTGTVYAVSASSSFTVVYQTNRDLFVRVRDGGTSPIKTFETPATLSGAGGSVSAIRTSDE